MMAAVYEDIHTGTWGKKNYRADDYRGEYGSQQGVLRNSSGHKNYPSATKKNKLFRH